MNMYDAVVIGAGLLGNFTARSLRRYALSVCVLEKEEDVCTGISKANASIIYSGYDVPADSLKAKLCVPACMQFPKLCSELGVRYRQCGSLLVCFGPEGEKDIREKYRQGIENGVQGLRLLSKKEVLEYEPNLNPHVRMALYSEFTGTVLPWELGIAAFENAKENGVTYRFGTEVLKIVRENGIFRLETDRGEVLAKSVINCAGLQAASLRETLLPPDIRIRTSVSDFAVYDETAAGLISHIIFSQTEDGGKGVTLIPTTDGKLVAESPVKIQTEDVVPESTAEGRKKMQEGLDMLLFGLRKERVIRYFSAVRANPYDTSRWERQIGSFTVPGEEGLLSFIGIKTPGLTCSEGLGRLAAEKTVAFLGKGEVNPDFSPLRKMPVYLHALSGEERQAAIEKNPLYGKILCRCGGISEGEVVDAIRAGARTLNGVKYRCGTGSGICQGASCAGKIAELLARETGRSMEEVLMGHVRM